MTGRKIRKLSLATVAALMGGTVHAAPQQALNKSVTVSMSITIPARAPDGSTQANPRAVTRTYYISSQGRVFARADRRVGKMQERSEKGPGETSMRLSGNSMVGVMVLPSGAQQLTITFDPSFSSCSARLIVGAEGGKPIVYKGLDGKTYTQTGPAQVSAVSCSVSAGNAFAS